MIIHKIKNTVHFLYEATCSKNAMNQVRTLSQQLQTGIQSDHLARTANKATHNKSFIAYQGLGYFQGWDQPHLVYHKRYYGLSLKDKNKNIKNVLF